MADDSIQEILTVTGPLSYAYLAPPGFKTKNDDGSERYVFKTQIILDPTSPDVQKVKDAQRKVATAAWDVDAPQVLAKLAATDKLALHDGNLQDGEEYKGKLFISANAKKPVPTVVTMGGAALQSEVDMALRLDPKCAWANAVRANSLTVANVPVGPSHQFFPRSTDTCAVIIAIYAQSPKRKPVKWKERINAQLMGVQYLSKGAGLGGGGRVARIEEFGINAVEADAPIPAQPDTGAASGLF